MTFSKKDASAIKSPVLPSDETVPSEDIKLKDECEYSNFVLSAHDLSNQDARFMVFDCARFNHVRFNNSQFTKLRLSNIRFEKCDLSNAQWDECKINRIEMIDSKLTGFKAVSADVSNCHLQNCVGELVRLNGSKFKNTVFQNCQFRNVDFRFCDLEGATFLGCDLRNAEFYDAKLGGTDFRGSELMGIKALPADLKGAIINSQQAVDLGKYLASVLGIEIKDT